MSIRTYMLRAKVPRRNIFQTSLIVDGEIQANSSRCTCVRRFEMFARAWRGVAMSRWPSWRGLQALFSLRRSDFCTRDSVLAHRPVNPQTRLVVRPTISNVKRIHVELFADTSETINRSIRLTLNSIEKLRGYNTIFGGSHLRGHSVLFGEILV